MKIKQKNTIDMTHGSLWNKLLLFALPLAASSILQQLFNSVDTAVVGRFASSRALAAVGSNSSLIALMINLFIGISLGSNVIISRYIGQKAEEHVKGAIHTAIVVALCSGIFVLVLGQFIARPVLTLMGTPKDVLDLAVLYLRIYFLGMPAMMIYNFGSALLRAVGDTKRPLYYLFGAGCVNIVLNLLFVICFHMDVAGVALATVISEAISALLVLRCMIKEKGSIHLELRELHIYPDKFVQILKVGLPAGFQGIVFALSNVVIQSSINLFGATVVAGNSAAANIEGFVYMAMNSFYQATISFTSQNFGAGKQERINRIALTGEFCVIVVGLVFGNACVLFGHPLLGIYSSSPAVIEAGMHRLRIIARTYALCGIMDVMVGALRGVGYSIMPMIVSLIGACGLRLLWLATVFQIDRYHTVTTVYLSYPITWIITLSVHILCFVLIRRKQMGK